MSRTQLVRAFDTVAGTSPMAYLRRMRVRRMAHLLGPRFCVRWLAGDLNELADDVPDDGDTHAASLLAALDPTPMGWKHRDWFLSIDHQAVFDRVGNIGPTLWWNGEIIGSWAITATGELRTRMLADRGTAATAAIGTAAAQLHQRLNGATVIPAIRAPIERSITHGHS